MPLNNINNPPTRWVDVVRQGGYLTPAQRKAFERAIRLVTDNLHQVLSQTAPQRSGQFDFDAFVDSLEQDFLRCAGAQSTKVRSDAAQTAFWAVRLMADHLIMAQAPRKLAS
ncbi:DNA-binding protein [Brenneria izadpanahii]|uniref:DNA-binding protein n=2 Tax=Brenneria izadpanahii TaxID=2722756 RepID=A0ABX7UY65_9GAMM|nr:DNA-binding protein [Brenneria izadpanahii]